MAWTYVKPLARKCNEDAVLSQHSIITTWDQMILTVRPQLLKMFSKWQHVEERHEHWNFEKYATLHKKQHGILEG